ncbi:DUF885 domain-containing protein [Devriesea agamarum]|uniref:DUF885 domain-containing protein n=1 Tax=Devriesea agamarum TaxID=472569 RepID=UPI00071D9CDD|nr:DUF885 domain-containing protein [Devriesea agamarum]
MTTDSASAPPREQSALDALANDYLDAKARLNPYFATSSGIPGYDEDITLFSPEAIETRTDLSRDFLRRLDDVEDADDVDRVTRAAMSERLGLEIEMAEALIPHSQINNIASPIQDIRQVYDLMPQATAKDWAVIAKRLSRTGEATESLEASLNYAADRGVISSQRQLTLAAEQCRSYAAKDGFFATLPSKFATLPRNAESVEGLDESLRADLTEAVTIARKAYDHLAKVFDTLVPRGHAKDAVGRELYSLFSRQHLGMQVDLDETYAWGMNELAQIVAEQEDVARRILSAAGEDLDADQDPIAAARRVLMADASRTLHGTHALQRWMQDLSDKALADLRGVHFDIPDPLMKLECCIAETGSGGIYYTGPSEDFSRPGRMWWDVPKGVDTFQTWAEATTVYHEGVPGHHLQLSTQVLGAKTVNRWRALDCWVAGHGEGWALYAERLMEQLGYLSDDGDRFGMLDAQRMRAGRVVLDIGLHCELPAPQEIGGGEWTYEKAWDFMSRHWGLEEAHQRFELHRYLGWAGQAPSYKIGQRIWESLRRTSAARGEDAPTFHARALALGSVPLSVLVGAMQ